MISLFVGSCKVQAITVVNFIFWTTGCSQREWFFQHPSKPKQRQYSIWGFKALFEPESDTEKLSKQYDRRWEEPGDIQQEMDLQTKVQGEVASNNKLYDYDRDMKDFFKESDAIPRFRKDKNVPVSLVSYRKLVHKNKLNQRLQKRWQHRKQNSEKLPASAYVKPVLEEAHERGLFNDLYPQPLDVLLQVNPADDVDSGDQVYDYEYYGFEPPAKPTETEHAGQVEIPLDDYGSDEVDFSKVHLTASMQEDLEMPKEERLKVSATAGTIRLDNSGYAKSGIMPTVRHLSSQGTYHEEYDAQKALKTKLKETNFDPDDLYEDDDDESDLDEREMEENEALVIADEKTEIPNVVQQENEHVMYETLLNENGVEEPVFDIAEIEMEQPTQYQKERNRYQEAKRMLVKKLKIASEGNSAGEYEELKSLEDDTDSTENKDYRDTEDYTYDMGKSINLHKVDSHNIMETKHKKSESQSQPHPLNRFGVNGEIISEYSNSFKARASKIIQSSNQFFAMQKSGIIREEEEWVVEFLEDSDTARCHQRNLQFCPPVDGEWSRWSNWRCSEPCGGGFLQRTRECVDPMPSSGGQDCPGDDVQWILEEQCNGKACPFSPLSEELRSVLTIEMKSESRNLQIPEGGSADFPCSTYWSDLVLDMFPGSKLVWYHNSEMMNFNPKKMVYSKGVLTLKSLKAPDDNGVYYCQLELQPADKQVVRFTTLTIDTERVQYNLTSGKSWQLRCNGAILGQLYSNAKQKWLLNDEVYVDFSNKNPTQINDWVIDNVTSDLEGQWLCVITAENKRWITNKLNVIVASVEVSHKGFKFGIDKQYLLILVASLCLLLLVAIICLALFLISYLYLKTDMIGMQQWESGALRDQLLPKTKSDNVCFLVDALPSPKEGKVCKYENWHKIIRDLEIGKSEVKCMQALQVKLPKTLLTSSSSNYYYDDSSTKVTLSEMNDLPHRVVPKLHFSEFSSAQSFTDSKQVPAERKVVDTSVNEQNSGKESVKAVPHLNLGESSCVTTCRSSLERQLAIRDEKLFNDRILLKDKEAPYKKMWLHPMPTEQISSSSFTTSDDSALTYVRKLSKNTNHALTYKPLLSRNVRNIQRNRGVYSINVDSINAASSTSSEENVKVSTKNFHTIRSVCVQGSKVKNKTDGNVAGSYNAIRFKLFNRDKTQHSSSIMSAGSLPLKYFNNTKINTSIKKMTKISEKVQTNGSACLKPVNSTMDSATQSVLRRPNNSQKAEKTAAVNLEKGSDIPVVGRREYATIDRKSAFSSLSIVSTRLNEIALRTRNTISGYNKISTETLPDLETKTSSNSKFTEKLGFRKNMTGNGGRKPSTSIDDAWVSVDESCGVSLEAGRNGGVAALCIDAKQLEPQVRLISGTKTIKRQHTITQFACSNLEAEVHKERKPYDDESLNSKKCTELSTFPRLQSLGPTQMTKGDTLLGTYEKLNLENWHSVSSKHEQQLKIPQETSVQEDGELQYRQKCLWKTVMNELVFKVKWKKKKLETATLHRNYVNDDVPEFIRGDSNCEVMSSESVTEQLKCLNVLQLCPPLNRDDFRYNMENISLCNEIHAHNILKEVKQSETNNYVAEVEELSRNFDKTKALREDRISKDDWCQTLISQKFCLADRHKKFHNTSYIASRQNYFKHKTEYSLKGSVDHETLMPNRRFCIFCYEFKQNWLDSHEIIKICKYVLVLDTTTVKMNESNTNGKPSSCKKHVSRSFIKVKCKALQFKHRKENSGPQQHSGGTVKPSGDSSKGSLGMQTATSSNKHSNKNKEKQSNAASQASWRSTLLSWFYKADDSPLQSCSHNGSNASSGIGERCEVGKVAEQTGGMCPDAKDKSSSININSTPNRKIPSRESDNDAPKPELDSVNARHDVGTSPRWMLVSPEDHVRESSLTQDVGCSPIQELKTQMVREEAESHLRSTYRPELGTYFAASCRTNPTMACRSPMAYRTLPKAKRVQWSLACKGVPLIGIALAPCENKSTGTEDLNQYCPFPSPVESEYSHPVPLTGLARTPMPEVLFSRPTSWTSKSEIPGYRTSRNYNFDSRTVILGAQTPMSEVLRTRTPMTQVPDGLTPRFNLFSTQVITEIPETQSVATTTMHTQTTVPNCTTAPQYVTSEVQNPQVETRAASASHPVTQSSHHAKDQQLSSSSQQAPNKGKQQKANRSGNQEQPQNGRNTKKNGEKWEGRPSENTVHRENPKGSVYSKQMKNVDSHLNKHNLYTIPLSEFEKNPYGIHIGPYETCHYCPPVIQPNLVRCTDPPPTPTGGILEYHPAQEVPHESYCTAAEILQQQILASRNRISGEWMYDNPATSGENEELHTCTGPSYQYHAPDYRHSGFRPISSHDVKKLHSFMCESISNTPQHVQHKDTTTDVINNRYPSHTVITTSETENLPSHNNKKEIKDSRHAQESKSQKGLRLPLSPKPMPFTRSMPPTVTSQAEQLKRPLTFLQSPNALQSQEWGQQRAHHVAADPRHDTGSMPQGKTSIAHKDQLVRSSLRSTKDNEMITDSSTVKSHKTLMVEMRNIRKQPIQVQATGLPRNDSRECNRVVKYEKHNRLRTQADVPLDTKSEILTSGPAKVRFQTKATEKYGTMLNVHSKSRQPVTGNSPRNRKLMQTSTDVCGHGHEESQYMQPKRNNTKELVPVRTNRKIRNSRSPKRSSRESNYQKLPYTKEVCDQNQIWKSKPLSDTGDETDNTEDEEETNRSSHHKYHPQEDEIKHSQPIGRSSQGQSLSSRHYKHSKHSARSRRISALHAKANHRHSTPESPPYRSGVHRFYPKESADLVKECIQSQSGIWCRSDDIHGRPTRSQIAAMVEKTLQSMLKNYTVPETTTYSKRLDKANSHSNYRVPTRQYTRSSPEHGRSRKRLTARQPMNREAPDDRFEVSQKQHTYRSSKKGSMKKELRMDVKPLRRYQTKELQYRVRTPYVKPWESEPQIPSPENKPTRESRCRSSAGCSYDTAAAIESATSSEDFDDEDDDETEEAESGRTLSASYADTTTIDENTDRTASTKFGFRPICHRRNERVADVEETDDENDEGTLRDSTSSQYDLKNILKLDLSQLHTEEQHMQFRKSNQTVTDSQSTNNTGFSVESDD